MDSNSIPHVWENVIEYYINSPNNNSIISVLQRIVLATTVYYIWKERNSRLFTGELQREEVTLKIIVENVRLQLFGIRVKKSANVINVAKKCLVDMSVCNG